MHLYLTPIRALPSHFTTERGAPENGLALQIIGLAINNDGTQSAFVHIVPLLALLVIQASMLSEAVLRGQDRRQLPLTDRFADDRVTSLH